MRDAPAHEAKPRPGDLAKNEAKAGRKKTAREIERAGLNQWRCFMKHRRECALQNKEET
jgi:hypothetical protein